MAATWIEVFKTGTHTSGNGITKTYTEADLDNIVSKYNGQKDHEAPLVLGHPATDDPAYGWTKELKRNGQKLLAFVDQIADDIVKGVTDGNWKKVSIALYPDGLLRHIGLLGATPPAIKGLAPVQFAEGKEFDEYIWATDETRMPVVGRVLSSIRDFIIEKFGLDTANKIIDKDDVAYLQKSVDENLIIVPADKPAVDPSFSEQNLLEEEIMEKLRAQVTDLENKLKAQGDQFQEALTKGLSDLTNLINAQAKSTAETAKVTAFETAKTSFANYCETLCKEFKLLPAEKESVIEEYCELFRAEQGMTFAEGIVKPSEKMKERLGKRTALYVPGKTFADGSKVSIPNADAKEVPAGFEKLNVDPASIDIDKQIREYAEKNNVSYEVAAQNYGASA